jgi:hypothetical protein
MAECVIADVWRGVVCGLVILEMTEMFPCRATLHSLSQCDIVGRGLRTSKSDGSEYVASNKL